MIVAHVGGVPVEEFMQPVLIALMLSGAWIGAHLRGRRRITSRTERSPR